MGASDFITIAKGTTAQKAFASAQEDACYEHGHGGYTGTIAEVNSFRMIDVEREAERALKQLSEDAKYFTVKAQKELKQNLKKELAEKLQHRNHDLIENIRQHSIHCKADETLAAACKRNRDSFRLQAKELKSKRNRSKVVINFMIDTDHPSLSKSVCGCIETKKGEFTFFGWASS